MNRQLDQISGSIYDAVVLNTGQAAVRGLLPQIGQKVKFDDGREFVFCSTFEVEVAAEMVATATFSNAELAVEVAAIGAYEVVLTSAAIAMFGGSAGVLTKDRLAGGYIHMVDDTGEGYQYRIKGNTVGSAPADVTITLAAVDPCYSCTERMAVVGGGNKVIHNYDSLLKFSREKTERIKKEM